MSACNGSIQTNCDVSLTDTETDTIENCFSVMEKFKTGVETCLKDITNCSCWASLELTIGGVSACKDGGKNSWIEKAKPSNLDKFAVKSKEKAVKKLKSTCVSTFGACKKLEDKSAEYVYKCKTSMNSLNRTLVSLRKAKTILDEVKTKISSLLNASSKAHRYKRQDSTSIIVTIRTLITIITSTSVDSLGTSSLLSSTATTFIQTDTSTTILTTVQITQVQTYINTITGVIQTVNIRIIDVTAIIMDSGGNKSIMCYCSSK